MATQSIVFLSGGIESYGPNVALRLFQHVSTIETVFDMKGPLFLDLWKKTYFADLRFETIESNCSP